MRNRSGRPRGVGVAVAIALAFLGLVAVLVLLDRVNPLLLAAYGVLSVVALAMYRFDKRAAERGARRIPEANLHLVALLGGWPGALVARPTFRHKTTKQPFRTVFWGTVVANVAVLGWLLSNGPSVLT